MSVQENRKLGNGIVAAWSSKQDLKLCAARRPGEGETWSGTSVDLLLLLLLIFYLFSGFWSEKGRYKILRDPSHKKYALV